MRLTIIHKLSRFFFFVVLPLAFGWRFKYTMYSCSRLNWLLLFFSTNDFTCLQQIDLLNRNCFDLAAFWALCFRQRKLFYEICLLTMSHWSNRSIDLILDSTNKFELKLFGSSKMQYICLSKYKRFAQSSVPTSNCW